MFDRLRHRGEAAAQVEKGKAVQDTVDCAACALNPEILRLVQMVPEIYDLEDVKNDAEGALTEDSYSAEDAAKHAELAGEDAAGLNIYLKTIAHDVAMLQEMDPSKVAVYLGGGDGLVPLSAAGRDITRWINFRDHARQAMIDNGYDFDGQMEAYEKAKFERMRGYLSKMFPSEITGIDITGAVDELDLRRAFETGDAPDLVDNYMHTDLVDSSGASPIVLRFPADDGEEPFDGGPRIMRSRIIDDSDAVVPVSMGVAKTSKKSGMIRMKKDGSTVEENGPGISLFGQPYFGQSKFIGEMADDSSLTPEQKDEASLAAVTNEIVTGYMNSTAGMDALRRPVTVDLAKRVMEVCGDDEATFRKIFSAASAAISEYRQRAEVPSIGLDGARHSELLMVVGEGDVKPEPPDTRTRRQRMSDAYTRVADKVLGWNTNFFNAGIKFVVALPRAFSQIGEEDRAAREKQYRMKMVSSADGVLDFPDLSTPEGEELFNASFGERGIKQPNRKSESVFKGEGVKSFREQAFHAMKCWNEMPEDIRKIVLSGRSREGIFSDETQAAISFLEKNNYIKIPSKIERSTPVPKFKPEVGYGSDNLQITIFNEQIEDLVKDNADSGIEVKAKAAKLREAIVAWNGIDADLAQKLLHNRIDINDPNLNDEQKAAVFTYGTLMRYGVLNGEKRVFATNAQRESAISGLDKFRNELGLTGVDLEELSDEEIRGKVEAFDVLRSDIIAEAKGDGDFGSVKALDRRKASIILRSVEEADIDALLSAASNYNSTNAEMRFVGSGACAFAFEHGVSGTFASVREYIDAKGGNLSDEQKANITARTEEILRLQELGLIKPFDYESMKVSKTPAEIEAAVGTDADLVNLLNEAGGAAALPQLAIDWSKLSFGRRAGFISGIDNAGASFSDQIKAYCKLMQRIGGFGG